MSAVLPRSSSDALVSAPRARRAPLAWVPLLLTALALAYLAVILFLPLAVVFVEALRRVFDFYRSALAEPDALAAFKLTLIAAAISMPLNLVFGICAAW